MNNEILFSSNSDEWATPQKVFDDLNKEFHFNLDPCATEENAKCPFFFTKEGDGLAQNWGGGVSFVTRLIPKLVNGFPRLFMKDGRTRPLWFYLFQPERTQDTFTIIFCTVRKSASLRAV